MERTCESCKHTNKGMTEQPCCSCKNTATDNFEPMTRADQIRNMSDEEMADFLTHFSHIKTIGAVSAIYWLKQPAIVVTCK